MMRPRERSRDGSLIRTQRTCVACSVKHKGESSAERPKRQGNRLPRNSIQRAQSRLKHGEPLQDKVLGQQVAIIIRMGRSTWEVGRFGAQPRKETADADQEGYRYLGRRVLFKHTARVLPCPRQVSGTKSPTSLPWRSFQREPVQDRVTMVGTYRSFKGAGMRSLSEPFSPGLPFGMRAGSRESLPVRPQESPRR